MHPLSITKSEFFNIISDIDKNTKKNVLSEHKMLNLLMENLSKKIKTGEVDFKYQLYGGQSNSFIVRDKFQEYIVQKGFYTSDRDMEELLNALDPYITNKINLNSVEELFGNEILEYKLSLYNRPNTIIRAMTGHLDGKQKMLLLFSLNECNLGKDNYLTKEEFVQGFANCGMPFNKLEVLELFELLGERYTGTSVISGNWECSVWFRFKIIVADAMQKNILS